MGDLWVIVGHFPKADLYALWGGRRGWLYVSRSITVNRATSLLPVRLSPKYPSVQNALKTIDRQRSGTKHDFSEVRIVPQAIFAGEGRELPDLLRGLFEEDR